MNKAKIIIMAVIFLLVCVFAFFVFTGRISLSPKRANDPAEASSSAAIAGGDLVFDENAYEHDILTSAEVTNPFLSTGIDNVFATVSAAGDVRFYRYGDGVFADLAASGTYKTTVTMSESDIAVTLTYFKEGDKIAGFGLKAADSGTYALYPYAFFRLMNFGENSSVSSGYMLLVDTTAEDFYVNDKLYEEPFIFYPEDGTTERLLSEANRTVALNGTKRGDYSMMTAQLVSAMGKRTLFLSGRHYAEDDGRLDLLTSGGSGNNIDNLLLASNVLGRYAAYNGGGNVRFLRQSTDGVELCEYRVSHDEVNVIKTFSGASADSIVVGGDYVFIDGEKKVLCNMLDGTELTVSTEFSGKLFPDAMAVGAEYALLRGYVDDTYPTLLKISLKDGSVVSSYTNNVFKNAANLVILPDGRSMITMINAEKYSYLIFN